MNKVKAVCTSITALQFSKCGPASVNACNSSRRYSRIYTRTGDKGSSSLFTGERRKKSDSVFDALGDIDELSCHIGFAREMLSESWQQENFEGISEMLQKIQCVLQDVSSCIATPASSATDKQKEYTAFDGQLVDELEKWIDAYVADLPKLKNFILPSGGKCSSALHISRSVCRRAERRVAVLHEASEVSDDVFKYVNRLSDFLFTAARYTASMEGNTEVIYKRRKAGDIHGDHDLIMENTKQDSLNEENDKPAENESPPGTSSRDSVDNDTDEADKREVAADDNKGNATGKETKS